MTLEQTIANIAYYENISRRGNSILTVVEILTTQSYKGIGV